MSRDSRKEILKKIETARESRVVSYVTSNRMLAGNALAQIGDDALRPIYDRLREIGHAKRLDFFIYSTGGALDVPWRVISALRQAADEWNILVPFHANSAATLIALGADNILLGRFGELGPIDPIMNGQRFVPQQGRYVPDQINVEDVMSYVKFMQERGGLSDQSTLANVLGKLADRLDVVTLGNVYRTHSHIRDVARRVLLSRKKPPKEPELERIVETLAEKVYAHNHAIGLNDAKDIGLPAKRADDPLEELMWDLLKEYETDLKLLEPIDPAAVVGDTEDRYEENDCVVAVVESLEAVHEFKGKVDIKAKRQTPPNVNLSLSLNLPPLPIPAGGAADLEAIQQALQKVFPQLQKALLADAERALREALKAQAPLVGAEAGFRGGKWVKSG